MCFCRTHDCTKDQNLRGGQKGRKNRMKNWRKFLSVLLAAVMVVTAYHVPARAADAAGEKTENASEEEKLDVRLPKLGEIEEEGKKRGEKSQADPNEIVRVSIVLKAPSALDAGFAMKGIGTNAGAKVYRATLERTQNNVKAQIEKATGQKLNVKWNFTLAANIISAEVRRGDIESIEALDSVKKVFIENIYEAPVIEPNMSFSNTTIGADTVAWANGYYGAGSRIMIIDTGTNQDHISFDPEAFEYALTLDGKSLDDYDLLTPEKLAAVAGELHRTIDPAKAYKNSKIPFAYNYSDDDYDTDHRHDKEGEHGSHVSGIAAANRYVKQNGEFVSAIENDKILTCGVAPDAQILTAKVFGKNGGAAESDYFAAIEDAIILECDAANLSLGSPYPGFAFAENSEYQATMNKITALGLTVVISAGNAAAFNDDDPASGMPYNFAEDIDQSTVGSPGSYVNSFAVASADNTGVTSAPLYFNGENRMVFYSENVAPKSIPIALNAGSYDYVFIDALGNPEDYEAVNRAVSLEGKVVMIMRGNLTFVEKGNNAIPYKPAALIVVNNAAGSLSMGLDDFTGTFPMVGISQADGNFIKSGSTSGMAGTINYYTGKIEITDTAIASEGDPEPAISEFSSWGGAASLLIKPEITAPGGNIWSVNGLTDTWYESMSGTSMAAPHVTGMAAVMAQYFKENLKADVDAAFADKSFSQRQLTQSLLMSTAVPMFEAEAGGNYYSIMLQGAGLANVGNAVTARSFLMMEDDATVSAADGKVKAELGQSTEGKYSYSFTIYNPSEYDLLYDLSTDLFTQQEFVYDGLNIAGEVSEYTYLDTWTIGMDGDVKYTFPYSDAVHDVDKDGDTDADDAQAILDYVSGENDGSELDLSTPVADLDRDSEVTSRDAYLLLEFLYSLNGEEEDADTVLVPAGTSKTVKVSIDITSWEEDAEDYPSGMWMEGFTYVTCRSISDDGELLEVEHSIPILGFYGSFTDASMFDANSLIEFAYGLNDKPYYGGMAGTGASLKDFPNYMTIQYQDGVKAIFTGNPYDWEMVFPEERLALNTDSIVAAFNTQLIRNAGTAAVAAVRLDENGEPSEVLAVSNLGSGKQAAFYYENGPYWVTQPENTKPNLALSGLGLKENDTVRIAYYAIPEYYAIKLTNGQNGSLEGDKLKSLLTSADPATVLGSGAYMGYDFTIDNTAPQVCVEVKDGKITVTASDNRYIAYVALADLDGTLLEGADGYPLGVVPEQSEQGEEVTVEFDVPKTDAAAIAVVVADYACNETAKLAKIGEGAITMQVPVYVLTAELKAGEEYIIASSNAAGPAYAMGASAADDFVDTVATTITVDEQIGTYIADADADSSVIWTTSDGVKFKNNDLGSWLGYQKGGLPFYTWSNEGFADSFSYTDSLLTVNGSAFDGGVAFLDGYFYYYYPEPVYLYKKQLFDVEVDPSEAWSIDVTPKTSTLILDVIPTVQMKADVQPVVLDDRSVTWTSSDPGVATVDENGLVTAVSLGTAVITATTKARPNLTASATINVAEGQPMAGSSVYAQVVSDGKPQFVKIDLGDMSIEKQADAISAFTGGGRSGNYVYGNDSDNNFHRYDITKDYAYDEEYSFRINPQVAPIDIANYPAYTLNVNGEEITMAFDFIGLASNSDWLEFDHENDEVDGWSLGSINSFVAGCYAGAIPDFKFQEVTYPVALVYLLLASDGTLYQWVQFYKPQQGVESAVYGMIAHVNVLTIGGDTAAYSMTYCYDEVSEDEGVFIADNTSKGIYYVDFTTIDFEAEDLQETDAIFVGRVNNATNLSTLYNDAFDSLNVLNSVSTIGRMSSKTDLTEMGAKTVTISAPVKTDEPVIPETEPVEPTTETGEQPDELIVGGTEAPAEEETTTAAAEEETTTAAEEEETTTAAAEEETTTAAEEEETTTAPAEEETTTAPADDSEEQTTEESGDAADAKSIRGSLNAVTNRKVSTGRPEGASAPATRSVETVENDKVVVTVTADEASNNGKLTITYDTENLKFSKVTAPAGSGGDLEALFDSVHVDEEAGTVTLAYATRNAVEEDDTLLEVEFESKCEDGELTVTTSERNEELNLNEKETKELEGTGHDWKLDFEQWEGSASEGYTKVTFTFVCQNDESHVETVVDEETTVSSKVDGNTETVTYKAEIVGPDGKTYTSEKAVTITTTYVDGSAKLVKVDESGNALDGASFGIYSDEAGTKEVTKLTAGTAVVSSADSFLKDLLPEKGKSVKLYVKEITAPNGYEPSTDVYVLTVEAKAEEKAEGDKITRTITYDVTLEGKTEVKVTNRKIKEPDEKPDTPDMGDSSNLPLFITMGSAATAALVGVMLVRRKKEGEE